MLNLILICHTLGMELCPGLKEYPAAVHFESKHYVHITTTYDPMITTRVMDVQYGTAQKQTAAVWWSPVQYV